MHVYSWTIQTVDSLSSLIRNLSIPDADGMDMFCLAYQTGGSRFFLKHNGLHLHQFWNHCAQAKLLR